MILYAGRCSSTMSVPRRIHCQLDSRWIARPCRFTETTKHFVTFSVTAPKTCETSVQLAVFFILNFNRKSRCRKLHSRLANIYSCGSAAKFRSVLLRLLAAVSSPFTDVLFTVHFNFQTKKRFAN